MASNRSREHPRSISRHRRCKMQRHILTCPAWMIIFAASRLFSWCNRQRRVWWNVSHCDSHRSAPKIPTKSPSKMWMGTIDDHQKRFHPTWKTRCPIKSANYATVCGFGIRNRALRFQAFSCHGSSRSTCIEHITNATSYYHRSWVIHPQYSINDAC